MCIVNIQRVWRAAILLFAIVICALPAKAGGRIGHARCCGRQDVILVRGGAGYWPGAKHLADSLDRLGYAATVTYEWDYASVADEVAVALTEGRMTGGVVIVGYSSGADRACKIAERLGQRGIRVNTLVLIESTFGTPVPANVDYCVNYYESRSFDFVPMFRGVPVVARDPNTVLTNVDVGVDRQLQFLAERNHFTLCNSPILHNLIGRQIAARNPATVDPNSSMRYTTLPSQSSNR